jgi:hypothetical protein
MGRMSICAAVAGSKSTAEEADLTCRGVALTQARSSASGDFPFCIDPEE